MAGVVLFRAEASCLFFSLCGCLRVCLFLRAKVGYYPMFCKVFMVIVERHVRSFVGTPRLVFILEHAASVAALRVRTALNHRAFFLW